MLRLVHPAKQGKVPARPKGRRTGALTPTAEERLRIRAFVKNLSRAYGGYDVLAEVMGVSIGTVSKLYKHASYAVAIRAARAGGITVEQVLSGQPHVVGACAVCGRKGAR
jgi:hypothetical protein